MTEGQKAGRTRSWLQDMLDNAEAIIRYTQDVPRHAFLEDEMRQDAVVRRLEVIGEAADRIMKARPDYDVIFPGLPLRLVKDTKNLVIHEYHRVSAQLVWKTAVREFQTC